MERLACGGCGASLNVPDGARFVSCLHCGSSLKVQYNESVAYTEVVETLQEHATQLAEMQSAIREQQNLQEQLALQNELLRIDQRWERETARWMWTDKNGGRHLPSKLHAVGLGLLTIVVTVFSSQIFPRMAPQEAMLAEQIGFFPTAIWLLFPLVGGLSTVWTFWKAHRFEQAQAEHLRERVKIVVRLSPQNALKLPR